MIMNTRKLIDRLAEISVKKREVQTRDEVKVAAALIVLGYNEEENPVAYWQASDILHSLLEGKQIKVES